MACDVAADGGDQSKRQRARFAQRFDNRRFGAAGMAAELESGLRHPADCLRVFGTFSPDFDMHTLFSLALVELSGGLIR